MKTIADTCTASGDPHRVGPGFGQDPYPFLNALRDQGPVHRVLLPDGTESWWITGYDEVAEALADHRSFSSQVHNAVRSPQIQNSQALIRKDDLLRLVMINRDPPDHTRMRKLVVGTFSAAKVEALRPRITEIAVRAIEQMENDNKVDLVSRYAFPVPVGVICELLGVPLDDSSRLGSLVTAMVGASSPQEARAAIEGLKEFMLETIAAKLASPGNDLLTDLARANREGVITQQELPAMALQILAAGHESSIFLISSGIFNLLKNPEQLAIVQRDPASLVKAVQETLRFEPPPVPGVFRHATEAVSVAGTTIPAGALVILSLAAANREASRFNDPNVFDVTRAHNPHLSFGGGVHTCLGARLAILEGTVAIGELLRRFPCIQLAISPDEVQRRPLNFLQRLTELPVLLHGSENSRPSPSLRSHCHQPQAHN